MRKSFHALEFLAVEPGENRLQDLDIPDRPGPFDDEQQLALRKLEGVSDVMFAVAGVHRGGDGADAQDCVQGDRELDPVRDPQADDIALSDSARDQRACGAVYLGVELSEAQSN